MKMEFFTAKKALRDYRENRNRWTGGALIVRTPNGYQAIPGAYLTDISYTGSKEAVDPEYVRAIASAE